MSAINKVSIQIASNVIFKITRFYLFWFSTLSHWTMSNFDIRCANCLISLIYICCCRKANPIFVCYILQAALRWIKVQCDLSIWVMIPIRRDLLETPRNHRIAVLMSPTRRCMALDSYLNQAALPTIFCGVYN